MEPPPRPDIDRWMGWEVAKLKFFGETFKISCDHKYIWVWPNNKKMYRAEGPGIYICVCIYTRICACWGSPAEEWLSLLASPSQEGHTNS